MNTSQPRVALVAILGSYDGPWARTQGHEERILIEGLGEGETIDFEYEDGSQTCIPFTYRKDGSYSFTPCTRFRFIKKSPENAERKSTFVKVLLR